MDDTALKILAVDDEEDGRAILSASLRKEGYCPLEAASGTEAWAHLEAHPDIAVALVDRWMPEMDGIALLRKIKADARFKSIPVIMQTAAISRKEVQEAMEAGAYHYLPKPFSREVLLAIVQSALTDGAWHSEILDEVRKHRHIPALLTQGVFRFRTLEEAKNAASFVANCFPDPERVAPGFMELAVNAVEHGNLGISYEEKRALIAEGRWEQEIARRLALPEYAGREATLTLERQGKEIRVCIRDTGSGFDWEHYLDIDHSRVFEPHGRGIAMSRLMCFDRMEYTPPGNAVTCAVKL